MIQKKNLRREPHTIELSWERTASCQYGVYWTLKGSMLSGSLAICRPSPRSRYRIIFDGNVIEIESTLIEAKHRALAEMSVLLHQEKQIVTIHRIYADQRRQGLKRWMER